MEGSGEPRESQSGRWDRLVKEADRLAKWPRTASLRRRSICLAIALLVVGVIAWLVAESVWRDELPRSTIAACALAAVVLVVFWLFGPSGWKTALGILSAIGAILVAAGTALDLDQRLPDGPAPIGALVDCPDYPNGHQFDGFVASTELGYALVRGKPNLHSGVLLRYPPGCRLAFDGYCLGEPKDDWRFDELDPVWFTLLSTTGYVPSADIRAGPGGGSLPLLDCPGGEPPPRPPEITAPARGMLTGPVEITAAAPGAIQVGFAVYYPEISGEPESARWHQIGVDFNTGDGITTSWDSRSVPGQGDRRPSSITLLAVPCLGLEFPAQETDQRSYVVANGGGPRPPSITPPAESLQGARHTACENVER